jgi:hypothetical protein
MIGKEKGLFSMVTQFYIKLKTRIILLPVNYGFFSTAKGLALMHYGCVMLVYVPEVSHIMW